MCWFLIYNFYLFSSSFESDSDNELDGDFEIVDNSGNKCVVNFKSLFPTMEHTYGTRIKEPSPRDFSIYQRCDHIFLFSLLRFIIVFISLGMQKCTSGQSSLTSLPCLWLNLWKSKSQTSHCRSTRTMWPWTKNWSSRSAPTRSKCTKTMWKICCDLSKVKLIKYQYVFRHICYQWKVEETIKSANTVKVMLVVTWQVIL